MSGSPDPTPQSGSVQMLVSDAAADDWATIGVTVLSVALIPQGGGAPVTVYTAPTPAPMVNLVQLDDLSELIGNASVPAGTYTGATLTLSGKPADFLLIASANPTAGFAGTPGAAIPSSAIQVQGASASGGSTTVPVNVTFHSPLVVAANQTAAVDVEFDLGHPAFIVAHVPPGAGTTLWAINFKGPVHHRPIADLARLVLRHTYGTVSAVGSGNASISIEKDLPALPASNPESAVSTRVTLSILADATNGTIFYDLDAGTESVIKDFSAQAQTLVGKYVRIAARYQVDGSLVGVRIWASSSFPKVWLSPEGHVLHVNAAAPSGQLTVLDERGLPVAVSVDSATEFFFRAPADPSADATPIGSGTQFLSNLVRGFKVHVSAVDPLATPLVAQSVDIESAAFSGRISNATSGAFTYSHEFRDAADDYQIALDYISPMTQNGAGVTGSAVAGFEYWDFAYPTLAISGSNAVSDYVSAVGGTSGLSFAGAAIDAYGASAAVWGDPANPSGWAAPWTVLAPSPLPLASVAAGLSGNAFQVAIGGSATPGVVDVSTTSGSATLVYQVDRMGAALTLSPIDISTDAGLATFTSGLQVGVPVKVYGVPQADGSLKAYVVVYFTGDLLPVL